VESDGESSECSDVVIKIEDDEYQMEGIVFDQQAAEESMQNFLRMLDEETTEANGAVEAIEEANQGQVNDPNVAGYHRSINVLESLNSNVSRRTKAFEKPQIAKTFEVQTKQVDMQQAHPEQPGTSLSIEKLPLQSKFFSKKFAPMRIFRTQLKTTEDKQIFLCQQCSMEFTRMIDLQLHIRNIHVATARDFKCDFKGCDKTFKCETFLKRHKNIEHSTVRELHHHFRCDFCPKLFKEGIDFIDHYHRVHVCKGKLPDNRELSPLHCPVCFKNFTSSSSVLQHIERVHKKKINFSCEFCTKKFYQKYELKRHIAYRHRFAFQRFRFLCNICCMHFQSQLNLERHINEIHVRKNENASQSTSNALGDANSRL
jgi:hypothetical protein